MLGAQLDARISVDERETTKIVLDIVAVAENNGLKLPREFGLLLKQVNIQLHHSKTLKLEEELILAILSH